MNFFKKLFNRFKLFCQSIYTKYRKPIKVVATTVVCSVTGYIFAPAFASVLGAWGFLGKASTGIAISSLHGAALTNASLAAVGGGAISSGGGGMFAGKLLISSASATNGMFLSAA